MYLPYSDMYPTPACPRCGYCPHCGRGNNFTPYWTRPVWPGESFTTNGDDITWVNG